MKKTIYFFTRHYPYHEIGEAFIEREIIFLSKEFDEIIIFPSNKHDFCRETPKNVFVNDLLIDPVVSKREALKFFIKYMPLVLKTLWLEMKSKGFFKIITSLNIFLRLILIQLIRADLLETDLKKNKLKIKLAYDYWFINSTLSLCFLKERGFINTLITRSHKMDVFDEVQINTGIPFRNYQIGAIDKMFTISNFNKEYFSKKFTAAQIEKIIVSYLGVKNGGSETKESLGHNEKVIVSCANMHKHKNIHLIPEILKHIKSNVRWIHFGKGDMYNQVQEDVKKLNSNIQVEMRGMVSNEKVIEFYNTTKVDLFLSLSESEGLPVSMMEALASDIPIAAYAIDGVPEIVKDDVTGKLFYQINDLSKIATIIEQTLEKNFDKKILKKYFLENFHEDENYKKFAKDLMSLYE